MPGFILWLHLSLSVWYFWHHIVQWSCRFQQRACQRETSEMAALLHHHTEASSVHGVILWNHCASHHLRTCPISAACLPPLQLSPALDHAPHFPPLGVVVLHWCIPRLHCLTGCTGAHLQARYNPKSFSELIVPVLVPLCWKGRRVS